MTIKRYNQSGVGTALQFGRRGGQLEWDGGAFSFTDSAGAPATLKASDIVGGVSEIVTKNDLDRAVQGLNIKKSVKAYDTIPDAIADVPAYIADPTNFASYSIGDRILLVTVSGVASPANGIYEIADVSGNNLPVRPVDAIDYATIEGAYMYVDGIGSTDESAEGTGWVLNIVDDTQAGQAAYDFNQGVTDELISVDVKQFHGAGTVKGGYGIAVNGDIIELDATSITDIVEAVTDASDQDLLIVDTSASVRRVNHKQLVNDLGIYKDRIGSENTQILTTQDPTGSAASMLFNLELDTTTYTPLRINSSGLTWSGTDNSGITMTAGDSTGANSGGQIDITAGAAEAAGGGTGGRIVLTPGAGDGTTADGYVEVGGEYGLQLPYSDADYGHDGQTGMIRVRRDTTNGIDNLVMWDSQLAEWSQIGGGATITDLDGDTRITVESSVGGDNDEITINVGDANDTSHEVAYIAYSDVVIKPVNGGTEGGSGDITLRGGDRDDNLGTGNYDTAGNISIRSGRLGTGDTINDAGNVDITAYGGNLNLAAASSEGVQGELSLDGETINIYDTNSVATATVNIGTHDTFAVNVNTKSFNVDSQLGDIRLTTDGSFNVSNDLGMNFITTGGGQTNFTGNGTTVFAVTGHSTVNMTGTTGLNLNSTNTSIALSSALANITLGGSARLLVSRTANNSGSGNTQSMTFTQLADDNTFLTATARGDDEADNGFTQAEQYAQNIRNASSTDRQQAIPNVAYISEAVQNAELGGIATRSLTVEDGQTGGTSGATTFAFDKDVPANTRIRRVTVSVTEAFVGVAELEGTISAGGGVTLFDQDDVDITSVGTYIIEHAGTSTVSGTFSLVFDGDVETVATAGSVTVYVEFTI